MTQEKDYALDQAKAQMEHITELVEAMRDASDSDDSREHAKTAIEESPLSVEVRGGWHAVGAEEVIEEYMILLCTGGPAVRIIGDCNVNGEPHTARLEYQDWGTPWTEYREADEAKLIEYAQCFYWGE